MSVLTNTLLSLSSAILALCVGLIVYKRLAKFYRLLFFQVLVYVILDLITVPLTPANGWVFNIMIPIETLLLFITAQSYFNTTKSKNMLLLLFSLFAAVYLVDIIFVTSIKTFAYHASIMEGILLTGIYIIILYFQLDQGISSFNSRPITFICLGMAMYFAGSIPYLSTLFYLQKLDPDLNLKLFESIIVVLAHVRYTCIALGFYLAAKPLTIRSDGNKNFIW